MGALGPIHIFFLSFIRTHSRELLVLYRLCTPSTSIYRVGLAARNLKQYFGQEQRHLLIQDLAHH